MGPSGRAAAPSTRRALALVVGLIALFAQSAPGPVAAAQTWTTNLYDSRAFLYQDPYGTACVAASTMIMLNTVAYRRTGRRGLPVDGVSRQATTRPTGPTPAT